MIDPVKITNFKRTREELEELLIFCILVAGKTASIQAKKLELFLRKDKYNSSPFSLISEYIDKGILLSKIQESKLGQYNRLQKAFTQILELDVFKCTVQQLEAITGIGPKTARFFLLHSRANQKLAVLDTHLLKWLRSEIGLDTPKATPTAKKYLILEQAFLKYCEDNNKSPATLDLEIWNKYSSIKNKQKNIQ